jgi:hypothetical protein
VDGDIKDVALDKRQLTLDGDVVHNVGHDAGSVNGEGRRQNRNFAV